MIIQERLEELLKIYPSEEVEAKRWQKIATALGNRTTKQVGVVRVGVANYIETTLLGMLSCSKILY